MAVRGWKPYWETGFPGFGEDIQQLFDDFFGKERMPAREEKLIPPVDMHETKEKIVVTMDIPAVDPQDLSISITSDRLVIEGERKREEKGDEEAYYRTERIYGEFQRTIELPVEVTAEGAEARYRNGVLTIEIPKSEKSQEKEIKIDVE